MPMMPFAPGRLSTITCWPHVPVSFSATDRAMMSTPPPAAWGTMIRTGRFGNCCAAAVAQQSAKAAAAGSRKSKVGSRKFFIGFSQSLVPSPQSLEPLSSAARALVLARAQDVHQPPRGLEVFQPRHRRDDLVDMGRRQHAPGVGAELLLDLRAG